MVIVGGPDLSPVRAVAASAAVAKPKTERKKVTMAMKTPVPPAPKPSAPVPSPVAALSAPVAAAVPLAPPVEPPVSFPAVIVALPVPVPDAPVAPPTAVSAVPSPVVASSPQVASATTSNEAPVGVPLVADPSVPAVPHTVPSGQQLRPQSPDLRSSRPHSPAPRQERELSRRRPPAPAASAPAPGSHLRLPPVPPVAGVEFVAAGGGVARVQYPPLIAGGPASLAAKEPLLLLVEALQPPQAHVPEAMLGQLFHFADSLHALLLIQVLAHSSLPAIPSESFHDGPHDVCLDAADQLALLLAPVLVAPLEGGVVAAGQLDEAVRSLRRHLRAGSGAAAIGASTLVVQDLWRTLTGVLHALGAHRM
ncbi:unnamed protein product [Closterium sp. Naga37s-1]|nr:unnamed protein product [Closterium sp. Naga37s-1]